MTNPDVGQYYSLLFLAGAERPALTALYAFWQELREIPVECSDPDVARVKLGWWHEEVHNMCNGQPRHPVAIALGGWVKAHALSAPLFFEIIEALGQHILAVQYPTYAALCDYGRRTRGNIERLAAQITGDGEPPEVAELGARLELAQLLRDAGADARRGRCYLPQQDLARFSATSGDVIAGRPSEPVNELIGFAAARLREDLGACLARLPPAARPRLVPSIVAAEIARAMLARIAARPETLLRERPTLSPLRQLWIAWRTARHAGRSAGSHDANK